MDEVSSNMIPVETKKRYRINKEGVLRLFNKSFGKLGQPILKVSLVLLVLYLGFISFITFTNTPQKVRVTNLTGRSATVSWVTKYPSKGEVVFTEEDNFSFGPFSDLGKEKSYDDRDYAYAQLEQMQDIVDLRSEALDVENVEVKKQGRYYVHHVTVLGLEENTKYSFRVGNGTMWWDVDSSDQEYFEHEAPTTSEFWFNTLNDPESLLGPNPAYGRVYTMEDNDGFLTDNYSTDAMVFSYATRQSNEEVSMILSSLTNLQGGWTIDKANFRDLEGLSTTFEQGEDNLYVYAQFEDLIPRVGINIAYGVEDSPAPSIIANGEDDVRSEEAEEKELVSKLISPVDAFCWGGFGTDCPEEEESSEPVKGSSSSESNNSQPEPVKESNSSGANEWWKAYESDSGDARSLDNIEDKDNDYWNGSEQIVNTANGPEAITFVPEPVKENIVEKIKKAAKEGIDITKGAPPSVDDEQPVFIDYYQNDTSECAKIAGQVQISGTKSCVHGAPCWCKSESGEEIKLDFSCRPASCADTSIRPYDEYLNEFGDICDYTIETYKLSPAERCSGSTVSACKNSSGESLILNEDLNTCNSSIGDIDCCIGTSSVGLMSGQSCSERLGQNCGISDGLEGKIECCFTNRSIGFMTRDECENGLVYGGAKVCSEMGSEAEVEIVGVSEEEKVPCYALITQNGITYAAPYQGMMTESQCLNSTFETSDVPGGAGFYYGPGVLNSLEELRNENELAITVESLLYEDGYILGTSSACPDKDEIALQHNNGEWYCVTMNELQNLSEDIVNKCGDERQALQVINSNGQVQQLPLIAEYGDCSTSHNCKGDFWGAGTCIPTKSTETLEDAISRCSSCNVSEQCHIGGYGNDSEKYKTFCADSSDIGEIWWTEDNIVDSNNFVSKAYAGDIVPTTDDTFIYFPSDGLYEVFFDKESIGKRLALQQEGEVYYINRDGYPGYDMPFDIENIQDNEDIIFDPTSVEITASKIAENFKVELKEGINIVSFPFVPIDGEEALRASDLMSYTNTSSIRINHITFFEDGRWKPGYHALSTDESTNSGEDFVLTMGKGYLIIAEEDMLGDNALQVPGRALESEVPVAYKPGWNLVGVHGYIQSYSARTLLDSVNTLDGVTVDNVTWWPTSKGRYEGFQQSDGIEYGFDYPIVKDLGYFVRVSDFTPTDESTKSVIWAPGTDAHNTVGN